MFRLHRMRCAMRTVMMIEGPRRFGDKVLRRHRMMIGTARRLDHGRRHLHRQGDHE